MKKFFLLFFIFTIFHSCDIVFAQNIGSTDSPYSTNGWDLPEDSTDHYQLPIYRLLSNPGGWINWSQRKIDSLFNALIVLLDTAQYYIYNDTLFTSEKSSGIDTFTTDISRDTVNITGIDSFDVVIVTPRYDSTGAVLSVIVESNRFIVIRSNVDILGQSYNWIWRKKYQWH